MTNKEFKGLIDEVSMSLYTIAKAMNDRNSESFDKAYAHYVDRMNGLLIPFSAKGNSMIYQSTLVRVMSFKKDSETGEKSFKVSGSALKKFIKEQVLGVYCPNWEAMIVTAKKGKKSTEEQLTAILVKAKSEHIDITALLEKVREAEKVAA